jgi:hypothetical protein
MGDKRKAIKYEGWPGGLFSIDNKRKATRAHLLTADNVTFDQFGAVSKRPGIFAYGNYMPARIIGLIGPISVSAGFRYLSLENKLLVQDSPLATIHTYANGGRGQFLFYGNLYFHTNGRDASVTWASGAAAAAAALGAPLSRVCHIHNDRVFVANGTTLYETAPGTGPSSAVDNFATGASWAIQPDDGDPIFGLGSIDRDLYVFKGKTIWIQTGYTVNERQTRVFDDKHGCISPDSIQTVDLAGAGRAIIFLDSDRKLCAIYGGGVHEIGEIVQNELDKIFCGVITDDPYPTNYNKHRCVSAVHPDGMYLLGFAQATGTSPSSFTTCLVVHFKAPYTSDLGTRWPIAKWYDTGFVTEFDIRFGAMAYFDDLVRKSVAIGQVNMAANNQLFVMENPEISTDLDAFIAGGPTTYTIQDKIRTIDDDAGDDTINKNWCEVIVHISSAADPSIAYDVVQINDSDSTVLTESRAMLTPTANKDYACAGRLTNSSARCSIQISMWAGTGVQKLHSIEVQYLRGSII